MIMERARVVAVSLWPLLAESCSSNSLDLGQMNVGYWWKQTFKE